MCKYSPRFFVGYKFLATGKKSERQKDGEMTGQTEVHFKEFARVFMQTLTVMPTTQIIFGIKHFDTEIRAFLSSCTELKFNYKC